MDTLYEERIYLVGFSFIRVINRFYINLIKLKNLLTSRERFTFFWHRVSTACERRGDADYRNIFPQLLHHFFFFFLFLQRTLLKPCQLELARPFVCLWSKTRNGAQIKSNLVVIAGVGLGHDYRLSFSPNRTTLFLYYYSQAQFGSSGFSLTFIISNV